MQQILSSYIIFQSLLLAILLFTIGNDKKNKLLGGYFVVFFLFYSLNYWYSFIDDSSANKLISIWLPFFNASTLISNLFLFYYIQSLLHTSLPRGHFYLWGLPALYIVAHIVVQFVSPYTSYVEYVNSNFRLFVFVSITVLVILYYIWQIRQLSRELNRPDHTFSQHTKIVSSWLRFFLWYKLVIQFLPITNTIVKQYYGYNTAEFISIHGVLNNLFLLLTGVFLALIAYLAMRNPNIFNENLADSPTIEQRTAEILLPASEKTIANKERYLPETIEQALLLINKALHIDNLYLDNELSLSKLAQHTNLSQRLISYSIKKEFGQSLTEYINKLRVEYAKQLLANPANANKTIYAVALESGFNSEQTFYRIFKEATGITANQYRLQKQ